MPNEAQINADIQLVSDASWDVQLAEDGKAKTYRVSFLDNSVQDYGYWDGLIQMSLGGGDVSRVSAGRVPLLFSHNHGDVLGTVISAKREDGQWTANVRFRENDERAQAIAADIENGTYPRGISAGVRVVEARKKKDKNDKEYAYVSKWRLNELSLAPTPVYDVGFNQDNINNLLTFAEGEPMSQDITATAASDTQQVEMVETPQVSAVAPAPQVVESKPSISAATIELAQKNGHSDIALEAVKNGETNERLLERLASVTVNARPHTRLVQSQDREMQFSIGKVVAAEANAGLKEAAAYEYGILNEREAMGSLGLAVPMDLVFNTQPASVLRTTGANDFDDGVQTNVSDAWVEMLIDRTPILGMVDMMSGLVGNEQIPVLSDPIAVGYTDDVTAPTVDNPQLSEINLSPKQAGVAMQYTLIANHQTRGNIDRFFRAHAMDSIAARLEQSVIKGAGDNNANAHIPKGIINALYTNTGSVDFGAQNAPLTLAHVRDMVKDLDDNNIPSDASWAMVASSGVFHPAMTTLLDSGSGRFLVEGIRGESARGQREGTIQPYGYPIILSNMLKSADRTRAVALMGRFMDCIVGVWSNMEVIVDRITNVGQVKVSFIVWHDVQLRRQQSFVRGYTA